MVESRLGHTKKLKEPKMDMGINKEAITDNLKTQRMTTKQRKERLARDRQKALDLIRQDPNITAQQIADQLEGTPTRASHSTARRPCRASGWEHYCYVAYKVLDPIGVFSNDGGPPWRREGPEPRQAWHRDERP
jgi:hypothetical protein